MKILSAAQIRRLDQHTIEHEPIASADLMERAAATFCKWFVSTFPENEQPVIIFCGPGNNGGDGYAIARMLQLQFYKVAVYQVQISDTLSPDCKLNLARLTDIKSVPVIKLDATAALPILPKAGLLIDAIFGSGLSRPIKAPWHKLIQHLNQQTLTRIAVDIPSGIFADRHSDGPCFAADYTFGFELPKLAYLLPENGIAIGQWGVSSIGLHPDFIRQVKVNNYYIDAKFVQATYRPRSKYQHKGSFGHALLMAGKKGSVGAATLATRAALRSGAGLVTIHAPGCALDILQVAAPEAMVSVDKAMDHISEIPDLRRFKTIGIGCGIGTAQHLYYLMALLLRQLSRRVQEDKRVIPLVLDADALNLIAQDENGQLKKLIPPHSILTPHPKEFERLFGKTTDDFARNQLQREQAKALKSYIILKGAHSCIATPEGDCYFNSTGNPGMGTGGSGDVLTGLLTGLLAQGYTAFETCILGVYLHGLAGDLAAREIGQEALIAGDIIQHFGKAFQLLSEQ